MKSEPFTTVIELLTKYQQDALLEPYQITILNEIIARIKNISDEYRSTFDLNSALLNEDPGLENIRKMMTDENINKILTKAAKTDPQLAKYLSSVGGKVKKVQSSEVAAYDMGKLDLQPDLRIPEVKLLHSKTESIYHNLWSVILRLNQLPKFKNFKPKGIRDVRNHLIEHTDNPKTSGAYIFSFGISTHGPVLRPTKPTDVPAPTDSGLDVNIEEFLSSIVKILD